MDPENGVKEKNMYKVLITSSGTGSRLGELTKEKNKALVEIRGKPVIAYILDNYDKGTPFVITVGYKAEGLKDYLRKNYSDLNIEIVDVDNFEGKGSSLGYSMLRARSVLQSPFIFNCNDTIVDISPPSPETRNWNGGYHPSGKNATDLANQYSSFSISKDHVNFIDPKGNFKPGNALHIGLVGIKDYKEFWGALDDSYSSDPYDSSLNDCIAINKMIKLGREFDVVYFPQWYDTGNLAALKRTENSI